jgi:EAL domain-containing protein (putative c-di-GMP-specific phosphodiesterase class I)
VVFALELDASVTAEGVETAEQLDTLRSLSVDAAQGYYLGAPSADPFAWRGWPRGRLQMVDRVTG